MVGDQGANFRDILEVIVDFGSWATDIVRGRAQVSEGEKTGAGNLNPVRFAGSETRLAHEVPLLTWRVPLLQPFMNRARTCDVLV